MFGLCISYTMLMRDVANLYIRLLEGTYKFATIRVDMVQLVYGHVAMW